MKSHKLNQDIRDKHKLLLTHISSKICQKTMEDEESKSNINEEELDEKFDDLIDDDHTAERLISVGNNVYSKSDLKEIMEDEKAKEYVKGTVENFLSKKYGDIDE